MYEELIAVDICITNYLSINCCSKRS